MRGSQMVSAKFTKYMIKITKINIMVAEKYI